MLSRPVGLIGRWPSLILPLPLALATWAGCSDDPAPAATAVAAVDAGVPDVAPVEPADAGEPPVDCATDIDQDGLDKHLECTGLYASFADKTIAPEVKPFEPAVQFWSDGAQKSRFLLLPGSTTIDVTDFDEWRFPNGTKLWKEFKVAGKRIETRLFMKDAAGAWKHTTYRWKDDETSAVRKDSGEMVAMPGKPSYEIPTSTECTECHAGRAEPVLGMEAVSLGIEGAKGVTLASLAAEARLSPAPPTTHLTIPDDGTTKAAPALGWLHANCGHCHNRRTSSTAEDTRLYFLIRPSQLLPDGGVTSAKDLDGYTTAVKRVPIRGTPAPYYITPGAPDQSLVSILLSARASEGQIPSALTQMPPLVTRIVDANGKKLVDDWITVLPP